MFQCMDYLNSNKQIKTVQISHRSIHLFRLLQLLNKKITTFNRTESL